MAHPKLYNTWKETGWPSVCQIAYHTSGGSMIGPPGAGKHIHLLGAITFDACNIRTDNSGNQTNGTIIMTLPAESQGTGGWRFPGAVDMGENLGVYAETGDDVTLFYYIHDDSLEVT